MNRTVLTFFCIALGSGALRAANCPSNTVESGNICVDKYEASVWLATPNPSAAATAMIKAGLITTAQQATALGLVQKGLSSFDFGPDCQYNGAHCTQIYALSLPGVYPSQYMNWFMAAAA